MGAVPKRRISKTRRDRKRAFYLRPRMPHISLCPRCGHLRVEHQVCSNCGTYRGVEVLKVEAKTKAEK